MKFLMKHGNKKLLQSLNCILTITVLLLTKSIEKYYSV